PQAPAWRGWLPARLPAGAPLAAVALLAAFLAFERWHQVEPVPLPTELAAFPSSIGGWQRVAAGPLFPAADEAGFDQVLTRRYVASDGSEVDLLIGYYERQQQGRELVGYAVNQLLPADSVAATHTTSEGTRVADLLTTDAGEVQY